MNVGGETVFRKNMEKMGFRGIQKWAFPGKTG